MSVDFNLNKVTASELCSLLELAILNKNVKLPVTDICFELFTRQFHLLLKSGTPLTDDNIDWNEVKRYISSLTNKTGFCKESFRSRLLFAFKNKEEISLQILHWLEECNIMYFEEYCLNKSPTIILNQITKQLEAENNDANTLKHILLKLIIISYNTAITNVAILFCIQCSKIIDDIVDLALCDIAKQTENVKLLELVFSVKDYQNVYGDLLKKHFKVILIKAITLKEKVSINDAYVMQELWATKKIPENILKYYQELLTFHTLKEYIEIINSNSANLNWKMVLIILAVYVSKTVDGQKIIKELIQRRLHNIFIERNNSNELLICLLMAKQSCLERDNFKECYSEWYSQTFGPNSNLQTGSDVKAFSLLITTLMSVVTKEPEYALNTHIERSIRTAPGCQSEMLVYKNICRSELITRQESPKIVVNNTTLSVHTILDHALNSSEPTWGLNDIHIRQALLPHIQKDSKYHSLNRTDYALDVEAIKIIENENVDNEMDHEDLFCSDSEELFQ